MPTARPLSDPKAKPSQPAQASHRGPVRRTAIATATMQARIATVETMVSPSWSAACGLSAPSAQPGEPSAQGSGTTPERAPATAKTAVDQTAAVRQGPSGRAQRRKGTSRRVRTPDSTSPARSSPA